MSRGYIYCWKFKVSFLVEICLSREEKWCWGEGGREGYFGLWWV